VNTRTLFPIFDWLVYISNHQWQSPRPTALFATTKRSLRRLKTVVISPAILRRGTLPKKWYTINAIPNRLRIHSELIWKWNPNLNYEMHSRVVILCHTRLNSNTIQRRFGKDSESIRDDILVSYFLSKVHGPVFTGAASDRGRLRYCPLQPRCPHLRRDQ
jgi:hypothetical protein